MDLVGKIHGILTKRRYNRGAPHLDNEVLARISEAVEQNKPIQLIGFWGTGPKEKPNWADQESCAFLDKLNKEIKEIYPPGIEFTFIFATLHGIHNRYEENRIHSYVEGMKEIFEPYGFKYLDMEPLWSKYGISFEKIKEVLNGKPEGWWSTISESETIEKNALHRNRSHSPEIAAKKYFVMRELEKQMFKKEFPGYIFHAFSDPSLQTVLPDMPTLYFYGRESWSNAPWFVDFDKK